ncbi:MAG TPA: hypothetical protein VHE55_11300 [Fimbriimonadaceae bacterium]|nr:hypothetical protein [Fimbriimonadaceae bacterium]
MNKPTIVGSVTVLLGVGIASALIPCGVVQKTSYCEPGSGDGTRCYQPSAASDKCTGVAASFCIPTTLTCSYDMLTFSNGTCYGVSAANIPYTTYTQGDVCITSTTLPTTGGNPG